ncbi:MAG: hypothetical protein K1060chlam1_00421 [Candidatus Anoxychlamydiales bacterium]|nr:hypothetical protein [Candidatus Anoxychlamydiales bacterium]
MNDLNELTSNKFKKLVISNKFYCIYQISLIQLNLIDLNKLSFFSFIKTERELSIIAESNSLKSYNKIDPDWQRLHFDESIPFSFSGILSSVLLPLAKENISVLVTSSFNTDYIFFKKEEIKNVITTLKFFNFELNYSKGGKDDK